MIGLTLYQRLTRSTTGMAYLGALAEVARDWRRSTKAIGGYHLGTFSLTQDDFTRPELEDFYNRNLGCRLVETCYGMTSWEGYIAEMRMRRDGAEASISLYPSHFTNAVQAWHQNSSGSEGIYPSGTTYVENTDSQAEFGICRRLEDVGLVDTTVAHAYCDRRIAEFGWPRSREVGGSAVLGNLYGDRDVVEVTVAGYWSTLNWREWVKVNTTKYNPNQMLTYLVEGQGSRNAATEFVVVKRVEANTTINQELEGDRPRRMRGDLAEEIIGWGDTSGNVWQGGVYADRGLIYEQAPTTWAYQKRGPDILDKAGQPVVAPLLEPGFLVYNGDAPTGWARPGTASDWDDPRIRYCNQVEWVRDEDRLTLTYADEEGSAEDMLAVFQ